MLDVLHWDLLVEETPLCFVDKIGDPNLRRCAAFLSARALCESRMLAFDAELVAAAALQVASRQLSVPSSTAAQHAAHCELDLVVPVRPPPCPHPRYPPPLRSGFEGLTAAAARVQGLLGHCVRILEERLERDGMC